MTKIVASLISGNESAIIERCLSQLVQFCNAIVITFNGTDDSQTKAINYLESINFKEYMFDYRPWEHKFAEMRNFSLDLAEKYIKQKEKIAEGMISNAEFNRLKKNDWYIFVKDVDDNIIGADQLKKLSLKFTLPNYFISYKNSSETCSHPMRCLVKFSHRILYRYTKDIHETLDNISHNENCGIEILKGPYISITGEGGRSSNKFKYLSDSMILYKKVISNPYDDRSMFYLAQSLKDQVLNAEALIYFRKRYKLRYGNPCERYLSVMYMYYFDDVTTSKGISLMLKAIEIIPGRFEAPTELLRLFIESKLYNSAIIYGERWLALPEPVGYFNVSTMDYFFYFPFLLGKCFRALGNSKRAKELWTKITKDKKVPVDMIKQAQDAIATL